MTMLLNKGWSFIGSKIFALFCLPINFFRLKLNRVDYKSYPSIRGILVISNRGMIYFGNNIKITSALKPNPVGGSAKTVIYCHPEASIEIGNNVGISNAVIYSQKSIKIEENVMIGGGCQIYDTDFHSINLKERMKSPDTMIKKNEVIIREGAFIGTSSIILKGVEIGKQSIVAAGSIVTKSIPAGEIWGGNPAKHIRSL